MFFRTTTFGGITYLLLVKAVRIDGKPRQIKIANLGRLDVLRSTGELDKICRSLGKFSEHTITISEESSEDLEPADVEIFGPVLIFQAIWESQDLPNIINNISNHYNHGFNLERVIFANVLQRLMEPGSDRALSLFPGPYNLPFKNEFQLHYSYRAMNWLGKSLEPGGGQASISAVPVDPTLTSSDNQEPSGGLAKKGKEPKVAFTVRTVGAQIEELLFKHRPDVLTQSRMYFFDTTSFYFYGKGGELLGRRGFSKDHRSDLRQVVVGAVLDDKGFPISTEVWPGNTADVTTLKPVAERLKARFGLENICMVAVSVQAVPLGVCFCHCEVFDS